MGSNLHYKQEILMSWLFISRFNQNFRFDVSVSGRDPTRDNFSRHHHLSIYTHLSSLSFLCPPLFQSTLSAETFELHVKTVTSFPMPRAKKALDERPANSDVILPMGDPYMAQIIDGTKTHEFRRYCLKPGVERIWFYRTAPHSSITHACETLPARTRNPGDLPLDEDGLGNVEFNDRHEDWDGYDFAYEMVTVYELLRPIFLKEMKDEYGLKSAPRGFVYLPTSISDAVDWKHQKLVRNLLLGLHLSFG